MNYLGGKVKLGKQIGKILTKALQGNRDYYEPFVGGFNIIPHIFTTGRMQASDTHRPLINMYNALKGGWLPPTEVSEIEYELAKRLPDSDPSKAFIGFACGFGGKYFGGYSRGASKSYAMNGVNSLAKKLFFIKNTDFKAIEYNYLTIPEGAVIYCDPPYAGTTSYGGSFSSNHFWKWVEKLSASNTVFVSEYTCPIEHELVFEAKQRNSVCKDKESNHISVERLFRCETEK